MITYIVKVSGQCNLSCSYCYYFSKNAVATQKHMDMELLESFLYQSADISDKVQIIWHGGEPLVAGLRTFERILEIQEDISTKKGVLFRNKIQTNATLINSRWIEIFKRGNFGVGVSLDGPKVLHDKHRVFRSGGGSFEKTVAGILMLKRHNIEPSILAVVTKDSLKYVQEIWDFFIQQDFRRFDFLPYVEADAKGSVHPASLAKMDYARFMIEMFDKWFDADDPSISIRFFEELLYALLDNSQTLCKFSGSCGNFVTIDADGSVFPCDSFVGYDNLNFGNLYQESLSSIVNGIRRRNFMAAVSTARDECLKCEYWTLCHGGCSKYSYMWQESFQTENFFCQDRKEIFSHVIRKIHKEHPLLLQSKGSPYSINGGDENDVK